MKKIIVTGGNGRFGSILKNYKTKHKLNFPNKRVFNILRYNQMNTYLKKNKFDILIHLAGLSRPMSIHNEKIVESIDLNIIGTANVVKACKNNNIKLIYFSTNYVYPGLKGNYSETDNILPVNKYAWSKLGGECSVKLYENSLILRVSMTEKPFIHKKAFGNVKSNFIYHEEVAKLLFKLLEEKGILNLGGKSQSIFDFARKEKSNIKVIFLKKHLDFGMPKDSSTNISKLKKILKKK